MINKDGFYLNAMGEILRIEETANGEFLDESGNEYNKDGKFGGFNNETDDLDCKYDLIGFVPKELHYYILKAIENYHTNSDFKSLDFKRFVDESYIEEKWK